MDLKTENDDLYIDTGTGDLALDELADLVHQRHIIRLSRGQLRAWPLVGVGLEDELCADVADLGPLRQDIDSQLRNDGFERVSVATAQDSAGQTVITTRGIRPPGAGPAR